MSGAEIAGIVLGTIGAAVAVVHVSRSIWRRLQEERRWHCAFGGGLRYYYRTAIFFERTADGEMVNVTPFKENDPPIGWMGDWLECSYLCNASRSGICLENPIFTRRVAKVFLGAIHSYIPSYVPLWLRPTRAFEWGDVQSIAIGYPHPTTGLYSPTTKFIVSLYRQEQAPDTSGGEDQPDNQTETTPTQNGEPTP